MEHKKLSMEIIGTCVNMLRNANLTKQQFISAMCEIFMRTILGYCKAENLDPLETLTLFHQAAEAISLKGHDEARKEMEDKGINVLNKDMEHPEKISRTDAFIEKAAKWLSKHATKYYLGAKPMGTDELVEDFKIAMKL